MNPRIEEFDEKARARLGDRYDEEADIAHLLYTQSEQANETLSIEELWTTRVEDILDSVRTATEDAVQHALAHGIIENADAERQLRTWLRSKVRIQIEHMMIPGFELLVELMRKNPRWHEHARVEAALNALAILQGRSAEEVIELCENASKVGSDRDHMWRRIALKLVEQAEIVDMLIAHAEQTGEGPPGARLVQDLHRIDPPDARSGGRADEEARLVASELPRHWRMLLLSGPDPLRWLDLLSADMRPVEVWPKEAAVQTAEQAERLVREHLADNLISCKVKAYKKPNVWFVELKPDNPEMAGAMPAYLVRPRRGTVHRLEAGTLPSAPHGA